MFSEDVTSKLTEKGFTINKDDTSVTIEQVQYLLNTIGEASMAATLREKLSSNNKKVSI